MSKLYMFSLEVDGHFHGGKPVKPWVAQILGPSSQYGLKREFVQPLNDWKQAHRAWSGNTYGVVARFPLRDSAVYEISQCFGNSSKRYVERRFYRIDNMRKHRLDLFDTLNFVVNDPRDGELARFPEDRANPISVKEVTGLAELRTIGFVVQNNERVFLLRHGAVYRIGDLEKSKLVGFGRDGQHTLTEAEALVWLKM